MQSLFDINNIVLTVLNYPISLAELLGTLFGLWSVVLAAKARIFNYPVGIINELFFFVIFFQIQMYSDMLLQVYFFIVSLFGWWKWKHPTVIEQTSKHELKITLNGRGSNFIMVIGIALGFLAMGTLVKNFHSLLPQWFPLPAAFPYFDSLVAVGSIVAMYQMARKKLESWVLWVIIDGICVVLYYLKDIKLMSLEYLIFLMIAAYGLWSWRREYKEYQDQKDLESSRHPLAERC